MSTQDTPADPADREEYDGYSVDDETQLDPADTLEDQDLDDELDRGYSPPEKPLGVDRYGTTPWEAAHPRPLEDRLGEEEPDVGTTEATDDDGLPHEADEEGREVGDRRAGRLVDPDEGVRGDREKDLLASDVGIDGAAASAEEAAMHVIDDTDPSDPRG
ncbi:DUF5709 domain-containing protein [Nocardioides caeni]|uniref:DUF5709 domain-containing protein n=1 Tax=Nocardioides caeni TaxID=574700 RepID=A0A4S8N768_9ACTN|nr:DUF5709 domain-containing protein [Nocardioides caeni]THV10759.1 hypothetical protein E9934_13555 [Nocardioides caeni]